MISILSFVNQVIQNPWPSCLTRKIMLLSERFQECNFQMTFSNNVSQDVKEKTKIAFCNVKIEWFTKIAEGEKRVELRAATDYWTSRLQNATHVVFRNGDSGSN